MYELYDAVAVLDLPEHGPPVDPATVRSALAEFFDEDKEPRPFWIDPNEPWPPPTSRPAPNEAARSAAAIAVERPDPRASERASLVERLGDGGEVLEPRQVLEEGQLDGVGRPVAVLGDDQLGDARLVVGVVVLGAMKKQDDVGILLDRARFAQVGHPRPFVFAVLDGPVELREGDRPGPSARGPAS